LSTLGTFDTIIVNSVLHHLPDDAVSRILRQVHGRLGPGGRAHILELVIPERRSLARMMARMDRGRYPRRLAAWRDILDAHFEPVSVEPYALGGGLWAMVYYQGKSRSCVSR
jgi:SAM-dependent methyltransferase